jgi:hypothetical protein
MGDSDSTIASNMQSDKAIAFPFIIIKNDLEINS